MTTTREAPPASADAAEVKRAASGGAFARWIAGWRISLRMARRDIRRHVGRSLLVAVMVGLPVVVMVAGLTALETNDISVKESIPAKMGSGQAVIAGRNTALAVPGDPLSKQITISCEGMTGFYGMDGVWDAGHREASNPCSGAAAPKPATPIPGLTSTSTLPEAVSALGALTGGRVVPMASRWTDVRVGKRGESVTVLAVDGADPAIRGMVDLTSGRWPSKPGEYVVTDAGQRVGLPTSGTFEYTPLDPDTLAPEAAPDPSPSGRPTASPSPSASPTTSPAAEPTLPPRTTGTIVGTATAAADDAPVALVTVPPTRLQGTQFVLDRGTPVTWPEVQRLNVHGLALLSRDVVEHPDQAPPSPGPLYQSNAVDLTALSLLCLALLIESCLLAGPAFAVIAQRQRRSLALAAANGATRAQLRRTLLAQALVLGVASAVGGLVLGIGVAFVGTPLYVRLVGVTVGPFDVPPLESAVVVGFAVVASVISALIPARGLTKLDVVAALRGDVVSPRPHRGLPILGALLFLAGAAVVVAAVVMSPRITDLSSTLGPFMVIVGGIGLVIGALLLVPSTLALLGRVTAGASVPVRMATRDAARQRGRAIPTVAAIMAGAILLSGLGISLTTADEMIRRTYRPQAPMGAASLYAGVPGATPQSLRASVADSIPGAVIRPIERLELSGGQTGTPSGDAADGTMRNVPVLVFGPAKCALDKKVIEAAVPPFSEMSCPAVGVGAAMYYGDTIAATIDDLAFLYRIDRAGRNTLAGGGVLVSDPALAPGGRILAVEGRVDQDAQGGILWKGEVTRRELAARAVDTDAYTNAGQGTILMTPETARTLGAEVVTNRYLIESPTGEITKEQQTALTDAFALPFADQVYVERGYESPIRAALFIAFISVTLLILVATLTSTALSMGEARRDLATLAAVGAPDRIRRRISGVQAGMLAVVGTVLGLIVGAVPGAAMSWVTTARFDSDGSLLTGGYVLVPWLLIGLALVAVPILAGVLAALFVRVRPDLTRRTG